MFRTILLLLCALSLALCVGCGPVAGPMPVRLDKDMQKQVDQGVNKAFDPVDRLSDQEILDMMVTTHIYQLGVDKLEFRSEKKLKNGKLVMEMQYDRRKPKEDAFLVKVLDEEGEVLRSVKYTREDVERTYKELSYNDETKVGESISQEEKARRKARDARRKKINDLFPKLKGKKKSEK